MLPLLYALTWITCTKGWKHHKACQIPHVGILPARQMAKHLCHHNIKVRNQSSDLECPPYDVSHGRYNHWYEILCSMSTIADTEVFNNAYLRVEEIFLHSNVVQPTSLLQSKSCNETVKGSSCVDDKDKVKQAGMRLARKGWTKYEIFEHNQGREISSSYHILQVPKHDTTNSPIRGTSQAYWLCSLRLTSQVTLFDTIWFIRSGIYKRIWNLLIDTQDIVPGVCTSLNSTYWVLEGGVSCKVFL